MLAPAAEHDVLPIALHPAMTITGRAEDVARLTGACVGVTAPEGPGEDAEAAWLVGEALVVEMGAEPVRIPEAVRPLYHAALAHGANHLVTLVREAADLLSGAGIEPAERVLAPLLSAALDNALRHGDRALTGPVVRGDAGTIATHVRHLRSGPPTPCRSTGRWPGAPPSAPAPAVCSTRAAAQDVVDALAERPRP